MSNSEVIRHQGRQTASSRGFSGLRSALLRLIRATCPRSWTAGRAPAALRDMSDYLLRDIGLERDTINRGLSKPRL